MSTPDDVRALREAIVANQQVIDDLNRSLARKTNEFRVLQEISQEAVSTLDLDKILERLLDAMDRTLGFTHAMVLLADDAGEQLTVAASRGFSERGVGAVVPVGQGVIGVVAKRRRIMRMGAVTMQRRYVASVRTAMVGAGEKVDEAVRLPGLQNAQSEVAIPLVAGDRLVGVLAVESEEFAAFDAVDEQLLSILAVQAAGAVRNARLYQEEATRRRELDEANVKLERLNQAESQRHRALAGMVAGVAHEVNTPLGISRTAVSVIRKSLAPFADGSSQVTGELREAAEDTISAVDLLERNILRAHQLVQDFKKLSAGQATDAKEHLSLSEVVAETVRLFSIQARHAKLEFSVETALPPGSDAWEGYRGYLSQVLLNLYTNIERYAYPGGAGGRVEVRIAATETGGVPSFTLTVRDFGAGIPADDLGRVFEPFFTTGRSRGGTGLGLAIVHTLVTSTLKGSVEVESTLGQGTRIEVVFPRSIPD